MALIEDILALRKVLGEANIPTDKRHIYMSQKARVATLRLQGHTEEEIQKILEEVSRWYQRTMNGEA